MDLLAVSRIAFFVLLVYNHYRLVAMNSTEKAHDEDVLVRSPRAIRGKAGRPGKPGRPGDQGYQGNIGRPGMKGFPGPKGPKGFQGAPGVRGRRGDTGEVGETGVTGQPGRTHECVNYASGLLCLDAPTGKQGIKGNRGAKGNPGPKGLRGMLGLKGKKGGKGRRGAPGLPGLPGSVGGPKCTARYTDWVQIDDFVTGKQGMMCGDMEFLWNVITETENNMLRVRYHCCEFLQVGIFL